MKPTLDDLKYSLKGVAEQLKIGSTWRHYHFGIYIIEDVCIIENTSEVGVLYKKFDHTTPSNPLFCRPVSEWLTPMPAGAGTVQRFTRVAQVSRWEPIPEEEA